MAKRYTSGYASSMFSDWLKPYMQEYQRKKEKEEYEAPLGERNIGILNAVLASANTIKNINDTIETNKLASGNYQVREPDAFDDFAVSDFPVKQMPEAILRKGKRAIFGPGVEPIPETMENGGKVKLSKIDMPNLKFRKQKNDIMEQLLAPLYVDPDTADEWSFEDLSPEEQKRQTWSGTVQSEFDKVLTEKGTGFDSLIRKAFKKVGKLRGTNLLGERQNSDTYVAQFLSDKLGRDDIELLIKDKKLFGSPDWDAAEQIATFQGQPIDIDAAKQAIENVLLRGQTGKEFKPEVQVGAIKQARSLKNGGKVTLRDTRNVLEPSSLEEIENKRVPGGSVARYTAMTKGGEERNLAKFIAGEGGKEQRRQIFMDVLREAIKNNPDYGDTLSLKDAKKFMKMEEGGKVEDTPHKKGMKSAAKGALASMALTHGLRKAMPKGEAKGSDLAMLLISAIGGGVPGYLHGRFKRVDTMHPSEKEILRQANKKMQDGGYVDSLMEQFPEMFAKQTGPEIKEITKAQSLGMKADSALGKAQGVYGDVSSVLGSVQTLDKSKDAVDKAVAIYNIAEKGEKAARVGAKILAKKGAETAAKEGTKTVLGKIAPGVGMVTGVKKIADSKTAAGKLSGGLEVLGSAAKFVPGVGTAVGTALDLASAGVDMFSSKPLKRQGYIPNFYS